MDSSDASAGPDKEPKRKTKRTVGSQHIRRFWQRFVMRVKRRSRAVAPDTSPRAEGAPVLGGPAADGADRSPRSSGSGVAPGAPGTVAAAGAVADTKRGAHEISFADDAGAAARGLRSRRRSSAPAVPGEATAGAESEISHEASQVSLAAAEDNSSPRSGEARSSIGGTKSGDTRAKQESTLTYKGIHKLEGRSLLIFSSSSVLRRLCARLMKSPYFDNTILVLIIISSITLAVGMAERMQENRMRFICIRLTMLLAYGQLLLVGYDLFFRLFKYIAPI